MARALLWGLGAEVVLIRCSQQVAVTWLMLKRLPEAGGMWGF